jgi:hypothetical protein
VGVLFWCRQSAARREDGEEGPGGSSLVWRGRRSSKKKGKRRGGGLLGMAVREGGSECEMHGRHTFGWGQGPGSTGGVSHGVGWHGNTKLGCGEGSGTWHSCVGRPGNMACGSL